MIHKMNIINAETIRCQNEAYNKQEQENKQANNQAIVDRYDNDPSDQAEITRMHIVAFQEILTNSTNTKGRSSIYVRISDDRTKYEIFDHGKKLNILAVPQNTAWDTRPVKGLMSRLLYSDTRESGYRMIDQYFKAYFELLGFTIMLIGGGNSVDAVEIAWQDIPKQYIEY